MKYESLKNYLHVDTNLIPYIFSSFMGLKVKRCINVKMCKMYKKREAVHRHKYTVDTV